MIYDYTCFDGPNEVIIKFDSQSRNLTVEVADSISYTLKKLKCVTLHRISKAWPSWDDSYLADNLVGLVTRFHDDGELEEELQLTAFTLLYRHYGTAFIF